MARIQVDIGKHKVYTNVSPAKRGVAMEIGVKEARAKFKTLLDQVEKGREIIIRRRGREVARMVPPPSEAKQLPSLKSFRSSIRLRGEPLGKMVVRNRKEERY